MVASLTFSTKRQVALTARFGLFTRDDVWRFEGDDRAHLTSQDTYDLGTSAVSEEAATTRFNFFRIHQTAYRRIAAGLFAGAGLHFDDHSGFEPGDDVDADEWDGSPFVEYSTANDLPLDKQISAGLSANILFDTRDSSIDPRRGWLVAFSYRELMDGFLGGSSGWRLLHADGRAYAALTGDDRHRLAFWVFGDFVVDGTPPYFDLPATGMDTYGRSARGYAEGRFRGERLFYLEVEYRGTLTENGLIGMVAFVNTTTVTNLQNDEQLFDSAAPGAGAGLRVLINKRSRTNLCIDFGVGKDGSRGLYLGVQEAF
jgi:outer membrane protein assembly factor BamA